MRVHLQRFQARFRWRSRIFLTLIILLSKHLGCKLFLVCNRAIAEWICHAFVPRPVLVQDTVRPNATGLFQPDAEWRRRGLYKPLMYSKIAISACRRVSHHRRQFISALIMLKNVSAAALS